MKNVIIPVDFSETSLNAARYAAEMLKNRSTTNIILYSLFEKEEEAETTESYLESLKNELLEKGVVNVETEKEMGDNLIDKLDRLAFQKTATLIVMGITGRSPIAQALIGSNTLKMAEKNVCPVLIIPPYAKYNGVKNIAFACDFKDVDATPVLFIKTILDLFKAKLHVINVDSEHYISINEEYEKAQNRMKELLNGYNPEFYFMRWNSFHEAINQFAADYNIDIILMVPKYHSVLSRVLGTNTKELVYHSTVPVLAVHQ
ncbi:MAG: universal stress protein [Sphingobacteriales bacterium]|nr:MAG: universal stress protein [Sphingobacteriales bacterium]